jgi:glycosyltransferase 2 family protein
MTAPRWRRAAKWTLSIVVSAVLLYFSLRGIEWVRVWRTIAAARWSYIAASGAIAAFSYFLRGVRWRILLNAEGRLPVSTVFWANMAGYLGNNFLPARAGEVIRSLLISSRSELSKTYVLTTALGERLADVIALVLASSVVLWRVEPKPAWMAGVSGALAAIAAAGGLAILILPHTGNLLTGLLRRIPMPQTLRRRLLEWTGELLLGLQAFHDWGRFLGFTFLTAVVWSLDATTTMISALGLGLHIPFPVAMLLLAGLGLGSALPSTPGYVGVYQFVAVTVLVPFGIGRDAALAYILVAQAVGYTVVLVLGLPGWYLSQAPIFGKRSADIL